MSYVPGYWPDEQTGALAPVVKAYLRGERLDAIGLGLMRAYLKQWVDAPQFVGPEVEILRAAIYELRTNDDLRRWLARAHDAAIDPL